MTDWLTCNHKSNAEYVISLTIQDIRVGHNLLYNLFHVEGLAKYFRCNIDIERFIGLFKNRATKKIL